MAKMYYLIIVRQFYEAMGIRTQSEQIRLEFTPFFERIAKTDALVLRSEVHQMIGRFCGTVMDNGEQISIQDAIG